MRTEEFRAWLKARHWNGKPLTPAGISSRLSKAKRFERSMPELGLGDADLDAAFDRDGMADVTQALRQWCQTAAQDGHAPAELVGDTTNASGRINNVAAAVRAYRQFREAATIAVSDWPALDELRIAFLDRVPDFERFTQTDNGYERIERAYKDAIITQVREIAASGGDDEGAGRRIYRALIPNQGPLLRWQTDDDFARKFPELAADFYAVIGRLARDPRPVADAIMTAVDAFGHLRERGATTLTVGQVAAITITVAGMARPGDAAPFKMTKARELATLLTGEPIFRGSVLVRDQLEQWLDLLRRIAWVMRERWGWEPRDLVDVQGFAWAALDEDWGDEDEMDDEAVLARFRGSPLFRAVQEQWTSEQAAAFCAVARAVHEAGFDWYHVNIAGSPVRFGRKSERSKTAFATQGYLVGRRPPRLTFNSKALDLGIDDVPLDAEGLSRLARALQQHDDQIDQWFPPQPARVGRWPDELAEEVLEEQAMTDAPVALSNPTNLILYGPPGTGKTYATAEHAVRLCGETVPADRAALMARYHALAEAGRIEFVTFHQSSAYEEFVEGLRPVPSAEGGAGFKLEPEPGVFRRIARRAETSTGSGAAGFTLGDRRVFKMSIGEVANSDDHGLFEEAIANGYAILGFHDIDWSDARFADRGAMIEAVRAADGNEEADATSGRVQMPFIFRNWMRPGDLVIVSKGNGLFRAIGEITGDYRFVPRDGGDYAHQRPVKWLWVDRAGVPVSEIYANKFTPKSAYQLTTADLNIPALERYVASQQDAGSGVPEPFVIIIDEINRANISKVFGELITLLEADKRLGAANEIRVRLPYSGDLFGVPANLHVIGTMNTADRSIALIDKALRRRFTFAEMMPQPDLPELAAAGEGAGVDLPALLTTINDGIEYLLDREHRIGHAWFLNCTSRAALDATMREKIIPLIAEYFFEDWGKVADVLGGREDNPFLERITLKAPPRYRDEEPRYRWRVRDAFGDDAYARAIGG